MKNAADSFPPDKKPAQALPVVGIKDGPHTGESGEGAEARPNIFRDPLLYTKLHVPRPRAHLVSRSHLVERLQQGMDYPLTLVSAPAGFGKTTLLAQWLAEHPTPIAWLSLELEDNDPVRFLTYLIAALQTIDAGLGETALELLRAPQSPPPETVIALVTNDLMRSSAGDFSLVLDDYHVMISEPVHRALTSLVEHMPPQLHLFVVTRADPPLSLARLRALGQLNEVRADELRFAAEETVEFLHDVMGLALSAEAIVALESRTEGWIAGLQLAALALRGRTDIPAFLSGFTGSHRFVLDYLIEEVLSGQPAVVQSFLLRTSILDRLSGSLCEAVTGQNGGQALMQAIERANLFVISLDNERSWYRYHHLFAEVLRNRLQQTEPALVAELHRRASAWYEEHDLPAEAVQHALAARDIEHAAALVERYALPLGLRGQLFTVLGWLDALPETLVRERPLLCMYHAAMLISANRLEQALARLQDAELCVQSIPAEQAKGLLGNILTLRATIAILSDDIPQAVSLAHQALQLLPETDVIARSSSLISSAHAFLASGDVTAGIEREVVAADIYARASGDLIAGVRGITLLARMRVLQGRLSEASTVYEQVLQLLPRPEVLQGLVISSLFYYFGLGSLLYEKNDLEAAEHTLNLGIDLIEMKVSVEPAVATLGYTTLACVQQARGDDSNALKILNSFTQLAENSRFPPYVVARCAATQAQFEVAQGKLWAAIRWAEASGLSPDDTELSYLREREYLTLARVRIAQGRDDPAGLFLSDALRLLDRLLQDAEGKARMGSALEILILQALALYAHSVRDKANATLERALTLAEPEGYIRLFVDEGTPMLVLLRQAQARGMRPAYVATLLSAFGEEHVQDGVSTIAANSALVEPLTEREREVLHLLNTGASNGEVARLLVVSVNTVKRHVYNICGKLGVQSRTQALARARALHLL